jgi:hypothetical protein
VNIIVYCQKRWVRFITESEIREKGEWFFSAHPFPAVEDFNVVLRRVEEG